MKYEGYKLLKMQRPTSVYEEYYNDNNNMRGTKGCHNDMTRGIYHNVVRRETFITPHVWEKLLHS